MTLGLQQCSGIEKSGLFSCIRDDTYLLHSKYTKVKYGVHILLFIPLNIQQLPDDLDQRDSIMWL